MDVKYILFLIANKMDIFSSEYKAPRMVHTAEKKHPDGVQLEKCGSIMHELSMARKIKMFSQKLDARRLDENIEKNILEYSNMSFLVYCIFSLLTCCTSTNVVLCVLGNLAILVALNS